MPRPTKLTPDRQEKIVQALLAGNYLCASFQYAGISEAVGYEWLARGEGKDKDRKSNALYAGFAEAVRLAEAQAEIHTVAIIRQGLPDNPRLALDFLARRHPDRWGPKERREVTLDGGLTLGIVEEIIDSDGHTGSEDDQAAQGPGGVPPE